MYPHTALSAASGFSNSISAWSFNINKKKKNENFFLMNQT